MIFTQHKKIGFIGSLLTVATLPLSFSSTAMAISDSACTNNDVYNSTSAKAPHNSAEFATVVANSDKLQWPRSGKTCLSDTALNPSAGKGAYVNNRFYVDNGRLIFDFLEAGIRDYSNASNTSRMELRGKTFSTSGSGTKTWQGHVRLPNRNNSDHADYLAIGQLFASDDVAKIVWIKSKSQNGETYNDNYWFSVDTNGSASGGTQFYPIGAASSSYTYFRMQLDRGNDTVSIKRGGDVLHTVDVSAWGDADMYFKAGCYLQSNGKCRVEFDSLSFSK